MPSVNFVVRTLAQKQLTSTNYPGHTFTVDTVQIDDLPIVYEITASLSGESEIQRHAIGADGTGPVMTAPQLQAAVDGYRQQVADALAWRLAMAAAAPSVT